MPPPDLVHVFPGDTEVSRRLRALDWSTTPFGPPDRWTPPLRTATAMCLASAQPMLLWWGPRFVLLYNDASINVLGDRHPTVLGRSGIEAWGDYWNCLEPVLSHVHGQGVTVTVDGCSFVPILGEQGIDGILASGLPPVDALPVPNSERRQRILIVDDDDEVGRSLKNGLARHGYCVALAHDAPMALYIAREFRPEVVLVDVGLPIVDGFELSRRLRNRYGHLVLVTMTEDVSETERSRSLAAGCLTHLAKPHAIDELDRLLDALEPSLARSTKDF